MATNDGNGKDDNDLCCIEASVVTGFEECARGEAREKFDVADVKAARGKISWKIPISNVKEVIKMGSIDNCRVVIYTVPHFGFTELHESLAGIQKLVLNMDWEQGLRVWRKFNEFAHPIASKPDIIPSPEDLVDIVIVPPRAKTEKSSQKKNKKGGKNWKTKKEERKAKREQEKKEEAEAIAKTESVEAKADQRVGNITIDENGTKKVIVKQVDPNEPTPEIRIKVLIPGPEENMFPTDVSDKDQRDLEPMDVDRSMQQVPDESKSDSPLKSPAKDKVEEDEDKDNAAASSPSQPKSLASPFKQPSAPISILSSAKDFASSVIERLSSTSPLSSSSLLSSDHASSLPSCATPPSTPVHQNLDLFMKARLGQHQPSTSVDAEVSVDNKNQTKSEETGVDASHTSIPSSPPVVISSSVDKTKEHKPFSENNVSNEIENVSNEKNENLDAGETLVKTIVDANLDAPPVKKERDPTKPTFRVTCNRVGENHSFDSTSAAACLGSAIIRYFGWSVDLKNFDIEVLLNIDNEEVTVSLGITRTSLHNRNLVAFGPTTLRATICYNMLRLCRVRNGDFVCDPLCGTSAIPIEGSVNWMNSFFFGGDYHEKGIERSLINIDAINQQRLLEKRGTMKIGTVQWNIDHFPLRDQCVDAFVSDLPFGHRMGSRTTNRTLYPTLLNVMARTAKPGARACLLTEDKTSLIKALQTLGRYWQRRLILSINMGGLSGFVFLLTRTTTCYTASSVPMRNEGNTATPAAGGDGTAEAFGGDNTTQCRMSEETDTVLPASSENLSSPDADTPASVVESDK